MTPAAPTEPTENTKTETPLSHWRSDQPNILLTGTPGVGKSTLATILSTQLGLRHLDVSQFAHDRNLLADYDPSTQSHFMHEDAILDDLEPIMQNGAVILDHHSSDWFPQRWFHLVVVLSNSTHVLYDRLVERAYSSQKIEQNVQAEIMQVVYEEAVTSYPNIQLLYLRNDTEQDQQSNITSITAAWRALRQKRSSDHNDHSHHQ